MCHSAYRVFVCLVRKTTLPISEDLTDLVALVPNACNILVKYWKRPMTSTGLPCVLVELPSNLVLWEITSSCFYLQFAMSYLIHSIPGFGLICQMWLQRKPIKLLCEQVLPIGVVEYSSGDLKTTVSKENTRQLSVNAKKAYCICCKSDPCNKMFGWGSSLPIFFSAIEEDVILRNIVLKVSIIIIGLCLQTQVAFGFLEYCLYCFVVFWFFF